MADLIRVSIVENEPVAELAVAMLANEGIRAMWRKTDIGAAVWGVGPTDGVGGPIEILVLPGDVKRARELLKG